MPPVLLPLVLLSLRDPRNGIAVVLGMPWGDQGRWSLFGLAALLPTIVLVLSFSLDPNMTQMLGERVMSPFAILGIQALAILIFSCLTFAVGRWRGGKGTFGQAVLTFSWLQLCLVPVQLLILVVDVASTDVANILGSLFMLWTVWMLTNFICTLHGFASPALVLLGMFGTMLLVLVVLSFLAALVMGPPNV